MTVAPDQRHLNIVGTLHGGFLMAIVDHALFAGPMALGIEGGAGGVEIHASVPFLAPGEGGRPLAAVVDCLPENRRIILLRRSNRMAHALTPGPYAEPVCRLLAGKKKD